MKKLIVMTVMLSMACGVAFAAPDTENILTSVNVTSEFYMNVSANIADFGSIAQGGSAASAKVVAVNCYSNNGVSWLVKLSGAALKHTDAVATIPSDPNLKVYVTKSGGVGAIKAPYSAAQALPAADATIYEETALARGLADFNLCLPAMTVPLDQKAGAYSTTITLTMTE